MPRTRYISNAGATLCVMVPLNEFFRQIDRLAI
jgi:hypothetical protein